MNPDLLAELRRLLMPVRPDQTRVAQTEDPLGIKEEQRLQKNVGRGQRRHSNRFHNDGFTRLPDSQRQDAIRSHIVDGVRPEVRRQYLSPSSDSVFRSTGLPYNLAQVPDERSGEAWGLYDGQAGFPNREYFSIAHIPSSDKEELDSPYNEYRQTTIHEGAHRASFRQPGLKYDRPENGVRGIDQFAEHGERPSEQYAFLRTKVYDLLTKPSSSPEPKLAYEQGIPPLFPQNRTDLMDILSEFDKQYPRSFSSAESIARDLLSGRGGNRSVFGPEHPARAMLNVPNNNLASFFVPRNYP